MLGLAGIGCGADSDGQAGPCMFDYCLMFGVEIGADEWGVMSGEEE